MQRSATTDRALVMSRGKRFESARRLFTIRLDKPIMWKERILRSIAGALYTNMYTNAYTIEESESR
jgi:hypothetical protein